MNTPVMSRVTDKHEKNVFPQGTEQTQKMMNLDVANIHSQGGVIRNAGFHLPGYNYTASCPRVYLTDKGVSNGSGTTFATIQQANAATVASMPIARILFIIGCVLVGLALLVGAVNYFRPMTFQPYSNRVPIVFVTMFLVGLAFIVYDRRDYF